MGLKEQLQREMQTAAKERSSLALSVADGRGRDPEPGDRGGHPEGDAERGNGSPQEAILKVIATMVKQRRESIALYLQGNRPELAAKEEGEIAVLERFLPKALSAEEIERPSARRSRKPRRELRPTWAVS